MLGSSTRKGKVTLVALHTTEGITRAKDLGPFFERAYAKDPNKAGSSHVAIDDVDTIELVSYNRAAWTLRSGNDISDNAELCAFAGWDRAEWLRHPRMLARASQWAYDRCQARGLPFRKLTPEQLAAGMRGGVIGHVDWTKGMKDGSHWDPGPNFPWDIIMAGTPGMPSIKETIMADVASLKFITHPNTTLWWVTDGLVKRPLRDGEPQVLKQLGLAEDHSPSEVVAIIPDWMLNRIPDVPGTSY